MKSKTLTRFLACTLSFILCMQSLPVSLLAQETGLAVNGPESVLVSMNAVEEQKEDIKNAPEEQKENVSFDIEEPASEKLAEGEWEYALLDATNISISKYNGSDENVIIPTAIAGYTVQKIGSSAFNANKTLKTVEIPANVELIDSSAFYNCSALTSVIWAGDKVTKIGNSAFNGCTSLASITIPAGVVTIDVSAFRNCTALTDLTFTGETLTTVGSSAFNGCTALTQVDLPDSVTTIDNYAFKGCTNLTTFHYPVSFNDGGYEIINNTSVTSITIPEGVTKIAPYAFYDCTSLNTVELPETLTEIGSFSFSGATGISEIELPQGLKTIGTQAFYRCTGLSVLKLPDALVSIGSSAFSGCKKIPQIDFPASLTTMESYAFSNCSNLSSITYPVGLTSAETGIFSGCSKLTSVTVPEGVTALPSNIFRSASYLKAVSLPSTLTKIGSYALYGCAGLTSVTIPENVTTIGAYAFQECTGIQEISIPSKVTTINSGTFKGCSALETVSLPDGITTLENNAFENCTSLKNINYPISLVSTGTNIFNGCSTLASITVPEGVTQIPAKAFYGAAYLKTVKLPSTVTAIGTEAFRGCGSLVRMILPDGITSIENNTFYNCSGLEGIYIGEKVTTISSSAFSGCGKDTLVIYGAEESYAQTYAETYGYTFKAESLAYNESVIRGKVVDGEANGVEGVWVTIYDCKSLSFVMQEYTDKNGEFCFSEAETGVTYRVTYSSGVYEFKVDKETITVQEITVAEDETELDTVTATALFADVAEEDTSNFKISPINGSNASITQYTGSSADLIIPEKIGDYTISTIGNGVFKGNTNIVNVVIPDTVTSVGNNAFQNCTALETVRFAGQTSSLGNNVFYGCTLLRKVVLPEGLTSMGSSVFYNCSGLTEIKLPDSLKTMGYSVFYNCASLASVNYPMSLDACASNSGNFNGCTSLTSVVVPEGVTNLADYFFFQSKYITSVTLPSTLTSIDSHAFCNATAITDIQLPAGLETIGESAFSGCTGLESVTLPSGLKKITSSAFYGCTKITTVDFPASLKTMGASAFAKCTGLTSIGYPVGLTSCGSNVFSGCSKLTSVSVPENVSTLCAEIFYGASYLKEVTLPDSLQKIGDSAFRGCTGLTDLTLPASVTSIGGSAFYGCSNLTEFVVPEHVISIDNSAFGGCVKLETISLPDSLTTMGTNIFRDCTALSSINFPKGLTTCGKNIFYGCSKLTKIEVDEGMTTLPAYAFYGASSLQSVRLPDGLETIGQYAFSGCTSLKRVILPDSMTTVATHVFENCTALKAIWIGEDVASVNQYSFIGCSKDTLVIYGVENSYAQTYAETYGYPFKAEALAYCDSVIRGTITDSDGAAMEDILVTIYDCRNLEFVLQEYTDENGAFSFSEAENGVTYKITYVSGLYDFTPQSQTIVAEADNVLAAKATPVFPDAEETDVSLFTYSAIDVNNIMISEYTGTEETTVIIPAKINGLTVAAIGSNAFKSHTEIVNVVIPKTVNEIGTYAFRYCSKLEKVYFGGQTKTINAWAFGSCTSLKEIKLPEGLTSIYENVFENCTSLEQICLPDSVTTINNEVFKGCSALTDINYPRSLSYCDGEVFAGCSSLTSIVVPEGVTKVAANIFEGSCLTQIDLPDSLTYISSNAFKNITCLEEIVLPEGLKTIGASAFDGCSVLKEIELPSTLKTIGTSAFSGCVKIQNVEFPDSLTTINASAFHGCKGLTEIGYPKGLKTAESNIFSGCTKLKKVVVPDDTVTLYESLFSGAESLEEIVLPQSLEKIGASALRGCTSLTSIEMPDSLTSIGASAFNGCSGLTEVVVPEKVTSLGTSCFSGCTNLAKITLPDGLTNIDNSAFSGCTALKEMNYPMGLKTAGSGIFTNCTSLMYLAIPDGVTEIPSNLFYEAKYFKQITLPESLLSVGSNAFYGCNGLVSMTIPAKVEKIKGSAFAYCTNLESVYVKGATLKTIEQDAFDGCKKLSTLYLPKTVTSFGTTPFTNCTQLCIYCPYNSAAMTYAIKNNIDFVITDYASDSDSEESGVLSVSGNSYTGDFGSVNISGFVPVTLKYTVKDTAFETMSDVKVKIYFSQNYNIDTDHILLDGNSCDDYTYSNLVLTIPVTEKTGTISFKLFPDTAEKVSTYAQLAYMDSEGNGTEMIGMINQWLHMLTLSAGSITSEETISVSGTGPKSSDVLLHINNTYATTVKTTESGAYSATLTLPEPEDGKIYTLKAVSGTMIATYKVTYLENVIEVEEFKLYIDDAQEGIDLLDKQGLNIVLDEKSSYVFKVKVSNPEEVANAYVFSTKNNTEKVLEAVYDSESGYYVTEGYFDPADTAYVPGILSIGLNCVKETPVVTGEYDFATKIGVSESMRKAVVEESEAGDGVRRYTMDLHGALSDNSIGISDAVLGFTIETLDTSSENYAQYDALLAEEGEVIDGEEDILFVMDDSAQTERSYLYKTASGADATITRFTIDFSTSASGCVSVEDIAPYVAKLSANPYAYDEICTYEEEKEMRDRSILTATDIADKDSALDRSERLYKALVGYKMLEAVLPQLVSEIPTIAEPVSIVYTALYAMIMSDESFFMTNGASEITYQGINVKWADEPTAIIYEGVVNDRIEDVKITIYYKESADASEAVLWNAEEYSQTNPSYSDYRGYFLVDVPDGLWQAKLEADGYETLTTQWYESQPQQKGLMLRMVPDSDLAVSDFEADSKKAKLIFNQYVSPDAVEETKLLDAAGNEIPYTLVYDENQTDENGDVLAKEYTLVYTDAALETGAKLVLKLPVTLTSADGKPIEKTSFTALCNMAASLSVPEKVNIIRGTVSVIPITIYNYDASINVLATSEDESIMSVEGEVVVDANGNGIVTVDAKSAGEADLIIEMEGTQAKDTIQVTVGNTSSVTVLKYELKCTPGEGTGQETKKQYAPKERITLPVCTYQKSGYTFAGWSDGKTVYKAGSVYIMPENNVILTATWKANPVTKPAVKNIPVTKITLAGISKNIAAGKKLKLEATVLPENATSKGITWTSSNKKYATVASNGTVSVKKAGAGKTVTITATATDGSGVKATYKIKIMKHAVKKIKLKAASKTVKAGKKVKVKATIKTTGKKVNKKLKWTSSNTNYATVNSKGVVKTKKAGKGKTVTITATATDGSNKKAKVKIKIK